MTHPFGHPSSDQLWGEVSSVFKSKKIFQRRNRHIVFVCGGPVRTRSRSMRARFLRYAKGELPQFRAFLAEVATMDLTQHGDPEFINVADFETLVSDICDCVLLFLESAGAIAEVGYFANSETAVKKLLVVNDVKRQGDSFINLGPIDKINAKSVFRPTIWLDFHNPNFVEVKDRLSNRLRVKTARRFRFAPFSDLSTAQKLFVVFQVLYIFRALTIDGVIYSLRRVFGEVSERLVKHLLSILLAAEYVERKGEDLDYFVPRPGAEPFLDFRNYDLSKLQAYTTDFYRTHHRETYEILGQ